MFGKAGPSHKLPDPKLTNRITDRIGSANKNKINVRQGWARARAARSAMDQ
jgi:hypothetical protein